MPAEVERDRTVLRLAADTYWAVYEHFENGLVIVSGGSDDLSGVAEGDATFAVGATYFSVQCDPTEMVVVDVVGGLDSRTLAGFVELGRHCFDVLNKRLVLMDSSLAVLAEVPLPLMRPLRSLLVLADRQDSPSHLTIVWES